MYLRKTEKLQDTARGALYRMYSRKEYAELSSSDDDKKALLEATRKFFSRKKKVSTGVAFREALTESVRPEWLLWAVLPTMGQIEHRELLAASGVKPIAPPWSTR